MNKDKHKKPCSLTSTEVWTFFEGIECKLCKWNLEDHCKENTAVTINYMNIETKDPLFDKFYNQVGDDLRYNEKHVKSILQAMKDYYNDKYKMLEEDLKKEALSKSKWKNIIFDIETNFFSKTRLLTYKKKKLFIDDIITQGHNGIKIYRAYDAETKRIVALKLFPHEKTATDEFNNSKHFKECNSFLSPLKIESIMHSTFVGVNYNVIVMPILASTVEDFLKPKKLQKYNGCLPDVMTLDIVEAMINVCLKAHENSYVYGDMKLQNVGFDFDGTIKIFDVGGVVKIGEEIGEHTEAYFLDYLQEYPDCKANIQLDINCISRSATICADLDNIMMRYSRKSLNNLCEKMIGMRNKDKSDEIDFKLGSKESINSQNNKDTKIMNKENDKISHVGWDIGKYLTSHNPSLKSCLELIASLRNSL